jgi:hypothetical protein
MDHIRCYRSERGQGTILSDCPCTCHGRYVHAIAKIADWIEHNGLPCDDWVNAQFALDNAKVDIYRRTGCTGGGTDPGPTVRPWPQQASRIEQQRRDWHQLTGRESSW